MSESLIIDDDLMLSVGYNERQQAKSLGAKPYYENSKFKCWIVPRGMDLMPFKAWWPMRFKQSQQAASGVEDQHTGSRLSELMQTVKGTLERHMPQAYWIQAEVVGITGSSHVYLELADYDDNGKEIAKGKGTIFASQRDILRSFEEHTGMPIKAGMKVLLKAYVQFHELYGLSLNISEIDPRFTIGDMEAKLAKIRMELKKQGIFDSNRRMIEPADFTRIAVIAPADAAGLGDFKTQADQLNHHNLCEFVYFSATFQGQNAVPTLCKALDDVSRRVLMGEHFDVLVIIRGGGDKAGLYALNEFEIARRVCTAPVPVFVGIGHERDNTLLDELACRRLPTPSLVISHIAGKIVHNAKNAHEDLSMLRRLAGDTISQAKLSLDNVKNAVVQESKSLVAVAQKEIAVEKQKMLTSAKNTTVQASHNIKNGMTDLLYQDPKKVVNKGYGIIRGADHKVTGNAATLNKNENITISLRDGDVKAVISEITTKSIEA